MTVLPRCYVCCLLLLVVVGIGGRSSLRSADRRSVSDLAKMRIINQAEPLCREFLPEYETLRFVTFPTPTYYKNGIIHHLWAVDCQDPQGNRLLYALWDEDRKHLVHIGRSFFLPRKFTAAPSISAPQAMSTARDWAVRMRLATREEVQTSRNLLRRLNGIMNVNFYLPSRSIRVAMADSGEVRGVFAADTSEPSASPAVAAPAVQPCVS